MVIPGIQLALLSAAGGVGAMLRYGVDRAFARFRGGVPWGLLIINIAGSALLGLLVGAGSAEPVLQIAGVGLLGGYTTFSSASLEAVRLAEEGKLRLAIGSALAMLGAAVSAAALGMLVGAALVGG